MIKRPVLGVIQKQRNVLTQAGNFKQGEVIEILSRVRGNSRCWLLAEPGRTVPGGRGAIYSAVIEM
ncbi:MAG: hypothetical protein JXR91_03980 [Deltaproteobacteria bacterium]|nr:hypothetical protein [Deltaproteobacteria bacterium]